MAGSTAVASGVNVSSLPPNAVSGTVTQSPAPKSDVSAITTQQGANVVQQAVTKAAGLSTPPPPPITPVDPKVTPSTYGTNQVVGGQKSYVATPSFVGAGADAPDSLKGKYYNPGTTSDTKITLINPETEQTVTFSGDSISQDSVQQYLGAGYQVSEAEGGIPSWLSPSGTQSTDTPGNTALTQAKNDLDVAKAKLTNFNVSNDPDLQAMLGGITSQWDSRIAQMQNAEDSRVAALKTTGIRTGSQWTGGAGGVMGSIISAEEMNAVNQISTLESQKQSALVSAKQAYTSGKWTQYVDQVNIAQKSYEDQLSAVTSLQKAQVTQDAKLQQAQSDATRNANVIKLYSSGVTDPQSILDSLQKNGDTTSTLEDIAKDIKAINPSATTGDTFKFSAPQMSQLLASGLNNDEIQALHDYYNGNGDSSAISSLPPDQQSAVHDVLNGTAAKKAASTVPTYAQANPKTSATKSYTSGSLTYTSDMLGQISARIDSSRGSDHYVDPTVYQNAFDAWINDSGLAKDFLKNFPPKSYINPANTWLPQYLASKTSGSSSSEDISSQINSLFGGQ